MLDTSAAILLRDGHEPVLRRVEQLSSIPLISILTRVELEGGLYRDPRITPVVRPRLELMLAQVTQLPFEIEEAATYGRIVAELGYSRAKVIDRMIAAQALVARATLATLNPRDFHEVPGLPVADWSN